MEVLLDRQATSYKAGGPPILLVEDSPEDGQVLARALSKIGCVNPVYWSNYGEEALDFLFRRGNFAKPGAAPRPEVVILDLSLPGLSGRDVLYEIRGHPELWKLPVVVVSGTNDPEAEHECLEAGANDFLHKPSDPRDMAQLLRRAAHCWMERD